MTPTERFRRMEADGVFSYCAWCHWSAKAWQYWRNYRRATAAEANSLFDSSQFPNRQRLSPDVLRAFLDAQNWDPIQQKSFIRQLEGNNL